jgi:hypothetical protein
VFAVDASRRRRAASDELAAEAAGDEGANDEGADA